MFLMHTSCFVLADGLIFLVNTSLGYTFRGCSRASLLYLHLLALLSSAFCFTVTDCNSSAQFTGTLYFGGHVL